MQRRLHPVYGMEPLLIGRKIIPGRLHGRQEAFHSYLIERFYLKGGNHRVSESRYEHEFRGTRKKD